MTEPRGMIKELGKLHPKVGKLQKEWEEAQGKPEKTNDQEIEEWKARTWEEALMAPVPLWKGILMVVARPWAWKIQINKIRPRRRVLGGHHLEPELKVWLPGMISVSGGVVLHISERVGKIRRILGAKSKGLMRSDTHIKELMDNALEMSIRTLGGTS